MNSNSVKQTSTTERYCSCDELPLILGARDLIKLLGFSRTNVYYMLQANDFPAIVIGKRRLVHKEKLFEWLEQHENKR